MADKAIINMAAKNQILIALDEIEVINVMI